MSGVGAKKFDIVGGLGNVDISPSEGVKDSDKVFGGQEQAQFEKKELANRETINETAIEQISRTIDNVLGRENASENIKNVFLSLTNVLHHLYLYKKDGQQSETNQQLSETNQQLSPELLRKIADSIRTKNSKKIEKSELDPIRFMCVEAFERLAQEKNFEKFKRLMTYFDGRPDKQSDFIFSSIFPPYRQKTEDSNPATTALMTLWKNSPQEWMDFIAGIIDFDKANFNFFRNKGNDGSESNDPKLVVDVSKYGYRDEGSPMQVYQKSLSGIASFAAPKDKEESWVYGKLKIYANSIKSILAKLAWQIDIIAENLKKTVWSYGTWMPLICLPNQKEESTAKIRNMVDEKTAVSLYEDHDKDLRDSKVNARSIIEAISGQKVSESNKFEFNSDRDSLIPISTMQRILETLSTKEAGSLIPFTLTAKDEKGNNDTFTALLTADKYGDIGSMGNGDKIKIGLTDGEDSDFVCLKKIDESNVKLVLSQSATKSVKGDRIITPPEPHFGSIVLYPSLAKDSSVSQTSSAV